MHTVHSVISAHVQKSELDLGQATWKPQ